MRPRSFCPSCRKTLFWYDLIPVFSWLYLKGHCRYCSSRISFLYPAIELFTALIFVLLINFIEPRYWLSYGIFISALIVVIRTDLEFMLISSFTTLYLVPIGFLFAYLDILQISLLESLIGAFFGYFSLFIIAKLFYILKNKEGLGEGDMELMALIGAFLGIFGIWFTTLIGSLLGIIYAIFSIFINKKSLQKPIPFGPWLAIAAILFLFSQTSI